MSNKAGGAGIAMATLIALLHEIETVVSETETPDATVDDTGEEGR